MSSNQDDRTTNNTHGNNLCGIRCSLRCIDYRRKYAWIAFISKADNIALVRLTAL